MVSKYSFLKENSKGHLSAYDLNIYLSNTNSSFFYMRKEKKRKEDGEMYRRKSNLQQTLAIKSTSLRKLSVTNGQNTQAQTHTTGNE